MAKAIETRNVAWAGLTGLLILAHGFSAISADAKPFKSKKTMVVASATTITDRLNSYSSSPRSPSNRASAPVRFFTINQVLAKLDSQQHTIAANQVAFHSSKRETALDVSPLPVALPSVDAAEPFKLLTFRAPEGALWVKWRAAEKSIETDLARLQDCRIDSDDCTSSAIRLISIVDQARLQQGRSRIELTNRLVNSSIRYVSDLTQHGVLDQWSSPLSTFAAGQGDCEDYAIVKYVALRLAGVAIDDLRILLVRDRIAGDHAVLGVRHGERWLILDNRHLLISDSEELPHFTPLFALNHQGVKLFAAPYANRGLLAQHSIPAAELDGRSEFSLDATASRDAGLGDWRAVPLAL